jgi:hypothetical protein
VALPRLPRDAPPLRLQAGLGEAAALGDSERSLN